MLTFSWWMLGLGIVLLLVVIAILAQTADRRGREVDRLTGKVEGFTISEVKRDPSKIVEQLRYDANVCDLAGQQDMADRLRGYASLVERWLDDDGRRKALRRIANSG